MLGTRRIPARDIDALAEAFAAAPVTPGGWERALRLLADVTGSAYGQLIGIGGPAMIPFNWAPDVPEHALAEFVAIEGGSPDRNFRVTASKAPLTIVHEADYLAVRPQLIDDIYLDYAATYDIPNGIQTVLHQEGGHFIGLAVLRSARNGVSSARQRAIFSAAVPHALQAVRTQIALENQGALLLAGALEAMSVAAFVLDAAGRVSAMTPRAEAAVTDGTLIRIAEGRLRAADAEGQARLDQAIIGALAGASARAAGATLALRDPARLLPPVFLSVSAMGSGPWTLGYVPKVLVVLRGGSAAASSVDLLQQAFDLTSGEADVAAKIAAGLSREQIARERGVSPATVQTQLKSIFTKTGVNREVALAVKLRDLLQI